MLGIWYLGIDLVVGAGLVDGNAIHHVKVISSVEGYDCIEGVAAINSNCCYRSVEFCNSCWLFESCFFRTVVKNLPKTSLRNILYGNLIASNQKCKKQSIWKSK